MADVARVKRLSSMARVGRVADAFYDDLRAARGRGARIAWCGGFPTTFPILRAMDIAYFFEDAYAATAAARHKERPLQVISANQGYLPEMCSYARTTLGCAHMPEAEKAGADPYYLVPPPSFMLFVDVGCSMLATWSDTGRRLFRVPMFGVSVPYVWRKEDEGDAIRETARQFRELVAFLEDVTHQRMDWDRLKTIMAHVKEAITLRMEAKALAARARPSPTTFFDWASAVGAVNYALGTPLAVELFRDIKQEVAQRVAHGIGALPEEKVRVYWIGIMCWPYMKWWGETLADLGVNIIAANYTHLGFLHRPDLIDPQKPLESLAANTVCVLSYGVEPLAEQIIEQCRAYALDGVICHNTRTCRIFPGSFFETMGIIEDRLGIPGVFFEGDVADADFFATEQARTRVEALKESVLSRKSRAGRR